MLQLTGPRTVARTLIGGGGGCIFIYLCFARQISFQIDEFEKRLVEKKINTRIYPPPDERSSDGPDWAQQISFELPQEQLTVVILNHKRQKYKAK